MADTTNTGRRALLQGIPAALATVLGAGNIHAETRPAPRPDAVPGLQDRGRSLARELAGAMGDLAGKLDSDGWAIRVTKDDETGITYSDACFISKRTEQQPGSEFVWRIFPGA